jgi:hypothetical protein
MSDNRMIETRIYESVEIIDKECFDKNDLLIFNGVNNKNLKVFVIIEEDIFSLFIGEKEVSIRIELLNIETNQKVINNNLEVENNFEIYMLLNDEIKISVNNLDDWIKATYKLKSRKTIYK